MKKTKTATLIVNTERFEILTVWKDWGLLFNFRCNDNNVFIDMIFIKEKCSCCIYSICHFVSFSRLGSSLEDQAAVNDEQFKCMDTKEQLEFRLVLQVDLNFLTKFFLLLMNMTQAI